MAARSIILPIDGGVDLHVIEFDATISEKQYARRYLTEHAIGRAGNVSDHFRTGPARFIVVAVSNVSHTIPARAFLSTAREGLAQAYEKMLSLMPAQLMDAVWSKPITKYGHYVDFAPSKRGMTMPLIDVDMREVHCYNADGDARRVNAGRERKRSCRANLRKRQRRRARAS